MKKITLLVAVLIGKVAFSQIGVNTNSPRATFDITAKKTDGSAPEGLIAPRLTGDQIKAGDALYGTAQRGNIIYATAAVGTASTKTVNINSAGYYFFDGSIWQKIVTANNDSDTNIYNTNGTIATNRLVALDDKTLTFSSAATAAGSHFRVDGTTFNVDAFNNNVGIGTDVPTTKLDVRSPGVPGALRITDGTQAEGKVLTSDANGVATWRNNVDTNTNIYTNDGTVAGDRTVALADNYINFTSTATTGTKFFRVDANTFNVDMVNNRVGIGTAAPTKSLHISSADEGAIRITDGTQGAGKILVSDATGVGTWQKTSGDADVTAATVGDVRNMVDGTLRWTGAQITVPVTGYYIISPKVILDKLPAPSGSIQSCTGFVAYNLSKTPVAETDLAFTPDVHIPAGPGGTDFIFNSNIARLEAGPYFLFVRYGSGATGCTSVKTRAGAANGFTITLLK